MPPVVDSSNQYGSWLDDQGTDYIIPLRQIGKVGRIKKKVGKKRTSSPTKGRRVRPKVKGLKKLKAKRSHKRKS